MLLVVFGLVSLGLMASSFVEIELLERMAAGDVVCGKLRSCRTTRGRPTLCSCGLWLSQPQPLLVAGVATGSLEPFQVSPDHHGGGSTFADRRGELLGAARAYVARGEYPG